MTEFSPTGLRLDAPSPGDIVTVRVKRRPKTATQPSHVEQLLGVRTIDDADNPQHYRMNNIWRVRAVNGGQAVVECLTSTMHKPDVWSIVHHEWFEASELWAALADKEPTP